MKKNSIATFFLLLAVIACTSSNASPTAEPSDVSTAVAATLQAVTENAPTPQPAGIPASFQNISFMIPQGLADGAVGEIIPAATEESGGPWGVAPEYISFTLTNYTGRNDEFFKATISIYPAAEYAAVNSWAASSLTRLQAVLASPAAQLTNESLPTIPFNGAAAQQYAAQAKLLGFNGGNGVRMISQYAQFPGPILKDNSLFHYEGLTADGKYMVAVVFPIYLPLQTSAENTSADGVQYPADLSDTNGLTAYFQGITDLLNAASADSFQPALDQLDSLIQSITISAP